MTLAPVILFVYNRPEHTLLTLESLAANSQAADTHLIIYADGAKSDASAEALQKITRTREVLRRKQWCRSVEIRESNINKGLARSVTEGVSEVISKHGRVIVLEDDLVVAPDFLDFMNAALVRYQDEKAVACISGYVYPLKRNFAEAFFVKGADCWGWATWADRWDPAAYQAPELISRIKEQDKTALFDFNSSYPYMKMLEDRAAGLNQSWAIIWYASAFVENKLCLYPPHSLVKNTGNDGSGTHTLSAEDAYDTELKRINQVRLPDRIAESAEGREAFERFFRGAVPAPPNVLQRIIRKLKLMFS